ncbi:MAG: hypothetical protein KatS3mg035_0970 [Bacteroidia bacterium]|nr:MAG: hypothetical protein KatS3mg035_0970 [Bacteroidia bacterium]
MSENTTTTETTQKEPKSIKKTYYIKGVQFDNVHDYIGIRKHQSDFSVDTVHPTVCSS